MLEEKGKLNVLDSTMSFKAVWMKVKHVKKKVLANFTTYCCGRQASSL